jgi:integrase
MSALSETRIRAAKPTDKPYKLRDGRGLHLLVTPAGGRLWRFRYRHAGRESMLGLGAYPEVSLKAARDRREEARKLVAAGADPAAQRRAERAGHANTFEGIAREWLALQSRKLSERTYAKKLARFEALVFPFLGTRPIADIGAPDLLPVLRKVESRGKMETAHRVRSECGQIFRYAVATGRAARNPAADLVGALAPVVVRNHPAITDPGKIGELLRAIAGYVGQPSTEFALKIAPYVFVRPGELRAAQWSEFDLDNAEWRIPGTRMKMRELHVVPLARQVVELVRDLQRITGASPYLFPGLRTKTRPISNNTLNAALRRLGFTGDEMVSHGFRSMASTLLNEQGFHPDVIELQLAHAERNEVRSAYNRAQRLDERRRMMQAWADYLDGLREGGQIIPIKFGGRS